ncbi:hypothetical protein HGRIS_010924 [Hohenbuehelia grisea]|uniref:GH18 domain-containing protein n=1 Tax=Hohenbuehelia grisea TaxID=104357 RepID=A0ABR3IYI7_9AGAR
MAENNSIIAHEYDDEDLSLRMNRWVKGIKPSITTSFSVGGWSMNDGPSRYTGGIDYTPFFSRMAANPASRATFIQSSIAWARKLEFDGIDIDWEFIGDPLRGGRPQDKPNFTSLVSEMRAAVNAEASSSGKRPLLITVAAPAGPDDFANFDAGAVSQFIDWFNIMTYDFYGKCRIYNSFHYLISSRRFPAGNWADQVENHAPIADTITPKWSFTSAVDMYLRANVPSRKIMAGLPLYGRVWTLADTSQTSPGSRGSAGVAGRCTAEPGYMAYFEIAEIIKAQGSAPGVTFAPDDGYYLVNGLP